MFLRVVFQNIRAALYPSLVNFRGVKKYFHKKGGAQKILVVNDRHRDMGYGGNWAIGSSKLSIY